MTFRTERLLAATPQQVYAAFERAEHLATWWGPSGFTNTFETFDFTPGGHWQFVMHGPAGASYPNRNQFIELVPGAKVVIKHVSPPHFVLTVTLTTEGTGTRIEWSQTFEDAKLGAGIKHIIEPANEQNLDRLEALLGGAKTP